MVIAMEQLHMDYQTIMGLQYYIFENLLSRYSEILDERKKAEEEEAKKQGYDQTKYNPDSMMRQAQKGMPKLPEIKIPKM